MGIDGLCEAVERIYSMPKEEYLQMRKNCRAHVEKNFTVEKMVDEYEKVYNQILSKSK
jgi:glycosyltransferase involved in cell wall biosynthesis